MKYLILIATSILLTSCQVLQSKDPSSLAFNIPAGSTLSLNKDIEINNEYTSAIIQAGKITAEKDKDLYQLNCSFQLKNFGPRTIQPETFIILRTEDGREPAIGRSVLRYYTEVYLRSEQGTDIIRLVCSVWGDSYNGNFSVTEMQKALGEYFSFTFAMPKE